MSTRYNRTNRRTYRRRNYRKRNTMMTRKEKEDKQYPVSKYRRYAPTYPSKNSTFKIAQFQNPIFLGGSKLIHNQLYYGYAGVLSGGLGSVPTRVYRANSVFDPDQTGVGSQPIGFDEMMLFFEHFLVIRSKITVNFFQAENAPAKVFIYLSPDSTVVGIKNLIENGQVKVQNIDLNKVRTITLDCDVKKYFGRKSYRDMLDDKTLSGDVATDPAEQVHFMVGAYDAFGGTTDITVGYDVLISYDVIYHEARKVPVS